ncbi:MAG: sugar phosphate isomerase/epimerase [Kiritimatiellae bacterium]|nr:sugar phosphate isomerase/epimerase [Kiritimatiellia bacterium]
MMRLAVISGFLGKVHNRYMVYREDRSLAEKVALAARLEGIDGLELCYPADFEDPPRLRGLLREHGLGVSAVNFRARRSGRWLRGSFTSSQASERRETTDDLKRAIDCALELEAGRVTTCPLNDGTDVPFEADYAALYDHAAETLSAACAHAPGLRICIEYKPSDPMARCVFASAGETVSFCLMTGCGNLGVTLDLGHSLLAGERPAQAAALAARARRLFYVHLNDNDGAWDWDMVPGAYHLWETVELLQVLPSLGYTDDWYAFDVFAKEIDTVENMRAAARMTRKLEELASRANPERLAQLRKERNPVRSVAYLYSLL